MTDYPTASAAIADAIERICHDMIMGLGSRDENEKKLEFFLNMTTAKKRFTKFGKLSAAMKMAGLAKRFSKFTEFDPFEWDEFLQPFRECRDILVRQDATIMIHPHLHAALYSGTHTLEKVVANPFTNNELRDSPVFQQQYHDTVKECQLQKVMSIIRPYVLSDGVMDENTAAQALDTIKINFKDEDNYSTYLLSFFEKSGNGKTLPQMRPLDEVKDIFCSRKDLSVARCARKCEQLLQSMYQEVYGNHTPMPSFVGTPMQPHNKQTASTNDVFLSANEEEEEEDAMTASALRVKTTPRKRISTRFLSANEEEEEEVTMTASALRVKTTPRKRSSTRKRITTSIYSPPENRSPKKKKRLSIAEEGLLVEVEKRGLDGLDVENELSSAVKKVLSKRKRKQPARFDTEFSDFSNQRTTQDESDEKIVELDEKSSAAELVVQDSNDDAGVEEDVERDSEDEESDPETEAIEAEVGLLVGVEKSIEKARNEHSEKAQRDQIDAMSNDEESMRQPVAAPQKRKKWTEQETHSLKLGVRKHGVGSWTAVKEMFPTVLEYRTNVQIKDKWRVLVKNFEVS